MSCDHLETLTEHLIAHFALGLGATMASVKVSATEPTTPDEMAWWYKPATGGTGARLYVRMQLGDESWEWVYIMGAPAA